MVCLVAAQWLCVRAQCFRGEGHGGELMPGTVVVKWDDGRRGGVMAIVAGCNQSFPHTSVYQNAQQWRQGRYSPPSLKAWHSQIARYRGQQGHRNHHEHWHTCTRGFCSSDCEMPNSRMRGGWAYVGTNESVCARARVCACYCCILYVDLHALCSCKCWWAKSFWLWFCTAP